MSKILSLPSAKSARPRWRHGRSSEMMIEEGKLSHPSKPVSIIASISFRTADGKMDYGLVVVSDHTEDHTRVDGG